jgi:Uma2 family endonuclease
MAIHEPLPTTVKLPSLKMSYEEFMAWAADTTHAEWVDGEVIIQMPAKDEHQATLGFLYELLNFVVRLLRLGRVRTAPFVVKLTPEGSAREPDIFFVAADHLHRLTRDQLNGAPDLVIEVVSRSTRKQDWTDKFREYAAAGVPEYWLIDPRPNKQRADFFRLDDTGNYKLFATEEDEKVESVVLPGFWLRPAWLWEADQLHPAVCAMEMEGVVTAFNQQIKDAQAHSTGEEGEES